MSYQPIKGTGDGTKPDINILFEYLQQAHVKFRWGGSTHPIHWTGPGQIQPDDPIPDGESWEVYRDTPTTPLVNFTDTSVLLESDLDTSNEQTLYAAAEAKVVAGEAEDQAASAVTAAAAATDAAAGAASAVANKADQASVNDLWTAVDGKQPMLVAGTNIVLTDNGDDTMTVTSTATGDDPEFIRDTIAAALRAGPNVTITPDDAGDTITISAASGGTGGGATLADGDYGDVLVSGSGTIMAVQTIGGETFEEFARDTIGSALVAGSNITITPDDATDTITISSSATSYTDEQAQDAVGSIMSGSGGVAVTYDDAAGTIVVDGSGIVADDGWTYVILGSDFTHTGDNTYHDILSVDGASFLPNTTYEVEVQAVAGTDNTRFNSQMVMASGSDAAGLTLWATGGNTQYSAQASDGGTATMANITSTQTNITGSGLVSVGASSPTGALTFKVAASSNSDTITVHRGAYIKYRAVS